VNYSLSHSIDVNLVIGAFLGKPTHNLSVGNVLLHWSVCNAMPDHHNFLLHHHMFLCLSSSKKKVCI